jgi:adenylate cyclase
MENGLNLALLGKLEIRRDGVTVAGLNSAKAQALLCYLAVTGRPHFRTSLAGLLWGDMPETNARTSLRRELSALRRTVGEHLTITRQEVAFNRDAPYWIDVESFEAAIGQGAIEGLREAVELYRGDFLEGFYVRDAPAFEEWILVHQTRLRELALQALHRLSVHFAELGEAGLEGGMTYTSRLLALEPSREEAHRQLMLLLAQSGQRGAALAQYETCRRALADDLDVEPGPETRELYERIRDGELRRELPSTRLPQRPLERVVDLPEFLTQARVEPQRPVFVARERELAQLDAYLERALEGQGQVAFITGGPGRGKTALMTEFARRAMDRHPELLLGMGNCNAYSGIGDPYLPFREVLGMLTGDVEARWAAGAISREHARRLWGAVPLVSSALLDHGPYLIGTLVPGPGLLSRAVTTADDDGMLKQLQGWAARELGAQGDLEQSALFEQYTNVLRALAQQHPLLLLFDDLQWTDTASAGLLFHLGRRLAGAQILVLGAYRAEEVALGLDRARTAQQEKERHPLEKALGEFKRQYGDVWVDLSQTEAAEGRRLVDALVETEPNRLGEEWRSALVKHTNGHALFTVELLRAMQERGDLVKDSEGAWVEGRRVDWEQLPARIEAVIAERMGRLDPELLDLLSVASVEGEEFTAQVVARVQGMGERELLRVLSQDLEKRHRLVREQGGHIVDGRYLSRYQFAHALFQEYLYNGLSPGERRLLHGEVGVALDELYAGHTEEIAAQLVRHYASAGDPQRERHYAKLAGERAAAQYAHDEAVHYLSRALDLTPETNHDERFALLLARENVYAVQGDRESRAADLAALEQLVEAFEDQQEIVTKRASVALLRSGFAENSGHLPEAIKAAQAALHLAQTAQDVHSEAVAWQKLGICLHGQGDRKAARVKFTQGLKLARMAGFPNVEAACLRGLGHVCRALDELIEAEDRYLQALNASREAGQEPDLSQEAWTLGHLGEVSARLGNSATAEARYRQALATFSKIGDRRGAAVVRLAWGRLCWRQADFEQANSYLNQAYAVVREVGDRLREAFALCVLGWVACDQSNYPRSEAYFDRAQDAVGEGGLQHAFLEIKILILCGLSLARTRQCDFAAAMAYSDRSLTISGETGNRYGESFSLYFRGCILIALGDYSGAQAYFDRSVSIFQEISWPRDGIMPIMGLGCVSRHLGDYATAGIRFDEALNAFRSVGARADEGRAIANLALLCHQIEDDEAARELSAQALRIARDVGQPDEQATALTYLGHALAGLGRLGESAGAYQRALGTRHELGQSPLAAEVQAGLARVSLAQGDTTQALDRVEEILSHLQTGNLYGTDEPIRIYLTCYRVLRANQDPRAEEILETAHDLLQERAAKIDDEKLRRSFLENVTANRELVAEWKDLRDCRHAAAV